MSSKLRTVEEAISLIKDKDTVITGGFVGCGHPEEITLGIEKSYLEKGKPQGLNLVYAAGQGDHDYRGVNHFGVEGLVRKVVGGHWAAAPKLQKLAMDNKIEAYNLPQGVLSHLFRDIAAGKPATITHVGLKTFVDPRQCGGKLNDITKEDLVELIEIKGKEYLMYPTFPIDVAIIRGTYADEDGNVTMNKEAVTLDGLSMAQAAKNSGGIVIVQVEKVVANGSLRMKDVKIPGVLVDAVVESNPENHMQTFCEQYNPSYTGETKVPLGSIEKLPLNERKIIARRAAMELTPKAVTNLGIGMPEGVSMVANEEGVGDQMILTTEAGPIGGVPAGGLSFGASINADCVVDQSAQFDFYDGGGLDITFLGLAQCDANGNVNVSKFGPKIPGCGGFINISQNTKKVVYCGTFTAGGLKIDVEDKKLVIKNEGRAKKFVKDVEQITFSGEYAIETGQDVTYVTERAVFKLTNDGMVLKEIAPGVDLEKDVLAYMNFKPIIPEDLKLMDERIFDEEPMGLEIK
ncbi:acyl CoA:acetate/3-ketoacid CoA transferase [Clostridium sediminicola]|uniref:acyl CoA:acetate/3-ketoacid CoA transferase n=1 Tax=Clostridium sediminicola TaxID=3114879 RepID=UPI0031F24F3B